MAYYRFDSIRHDRGKAIECFGVLGYEVKASHLDSEMWEYGVLIERGVHG